MHIKYRPTTFDEVLGNEAIKNSLKEQLKTIPVRPILLEGQKGCAKSTLANIIAREFGKDDLELIEINCEQLSKVEDTRDLIDRLNAPSLIENKKCVIFDELHGLSPKSQEVLLIPLEAQNIKNNILYVACTTEVNNIKGTLLDRFTRFRVSPLSEKDSNTLITRTCEKEHIVLPKWLKILLIEKSEGNPRKLLTGLSKIRRVSDENEAKFLLELNAIDESVESIELFKLIIAGTDWRIVRDKLIILLKNSSPESIRISLMNITGGRLISDYLKEGEGEKLIKMYEVLRQVDNIPEKASLEVDIFKSLIIFK
jgi:DNA polymerase III subunit gamma/tau